MNLVVLQTKLSTSFEQNLINLELLITNTVESSFILAPELCLTGYSYDNMQEAANFSEKAINVLTRLSSNRTIAITLMTKIYGEYLNTLHIFHKNKLVHTQSKHQLFVLNEEKDRFKAGSLEDIKLIEIEGLKIGCLICFELRFIELWQRLQGADIILVPALWGESRKENYETLTQALAVTNQCFVMASSSATATCAKGSGIITPFGKAFRDDNRELLQKDVDLIEIQDMKKYLYVGIK